MREVEQFVLSGRAEAEAIMTATCEVLRPTGATTTVGYKVVPVYDTIYGPDSPKKGICKPQSFRPHETVRGQGGSTITTARSEIHFPVGAFVALPGDIIRILDSTNPGLAGLTYRAVADDLAVEHVTSYRVPVERNLGEVVVP